MKKLLLALSVLTVFVLTIGFVVPHSIMGQTNETPFTLQTYGDEVNFRSGVHGNWMYNYQQYDGYQPGGAVTGAYGDYRVTQRLQLIENEPNALGLSPNSPVTFTVPEGIEILGVHYRILNHTNDYVINPWRTEWRNSSAVTDTGAIESNSVIELSLSANVATFHHIVDTASIPIGDTLRIEVEFSLSIIPGFFAEHSNQVTVTVDSAGINHLPTEARTISVANVFDPIFVEFLGELIDTVEVGNRVGCLPRRVPVGDILITETAGGVLSMGELLVIYMSPASMHRLGEAVFFGNAHVDDSSGLSLSNPMEIMVNLDGWLTRAIMFEVIGESCPDGDGGYITITGSWIAGFMYPEHDYYIFVNGCVVGGNTQLMATWRAEDYGGRNTYDSELGRSVGMFNEHPYGVRINY